MRKLRVALAGLALLGGMGWWLASLAVHASARRCQDQAATVLGSRATVARAWLQLSETEALVRAELLARGGAAERALLATTSASRRAAVAPAAASAELGLRGLLDALPVRPGEETALVDPSGRVVGRSRAPKRAGDSLAHLAAVALALASGAPQRGWARHGPDSVRVAAAPVLTPAGEVLGAVVLTSPVGARSVRQLSERVGGEVLLLAGAGVPPASTVPPTEGRVVAAALHKRLPLDPRSAAVSRIAAAGTDWLAVELELAIADDGSLARLWLLERLPCETSGSPQHAAGAWLGLAGQALRQGGAPLWTWALLIGGLVAALLLSAWLVRGVERPCLRLARQLRGRDSGADADAPVPLKVGRYPRFLHPLVLELQLAGFGRHPPARAAHDSDPSEEPQGSS